MGETERVLPMYWVLTRREQNYPLSEYGVQTIIMVIACDLADAEVLITNVYMPIYRQLPTQAISYQWYSREPSNPIAGQAIDFEDALIQASERGVQSTES